MDSSAHGFSLEDLMTDDLYFSISDTKLSITLLYITSDAPKYDIIWTENSDVIDSFILVFLSTIRRQGLNDRRLYFNICEKNQSTRCFQSK